MGTTCKTSAGKGQDANLQREFLEKEKRKPDGIQSKLTQNAIKTNFPNAMKNRDVEQKTFEVLHNLGFTYENTLFADSSCPDEINHNGDDITSMFMHRWGEMFPLSGLAGLPFAGQTGWGAFSSHCPKDGNIVICFAPHVGIDCNGTVGKVHRNGIENTTTACGAAVGAYNAVAGNQDPNQFKNGYADHQMDCIKHLVADRVKNIKGADNEMATLAFQMYEIISEFLDNIIDMKWGGQNSKIAIVGGIMINSDGARTDRFLPLKFELVHKSGARDDIFKGTFGFEPYVSNNDYKKSTRDY